MIDSNTLFNKKFEEFLDDLIDTFPSESDLRAMRSMLDWSIRVMGVSVPQEMFNSCVAIPYGDKIMARNESFFLEECVYDTRYADINIINKLKSKWTVITDENKTIVWKYMHVLMILNKKCEDAKSI